MLPTRTVLCPVDFSAPSRAAFEFACALARDYGARLVVAHVVPTPRVFAPDGIAVPLPAPEPYEARAELLKFRPVGKVEAVHRLLEGDPAETVLRLAADEHANLIVMGTHGHTGLTRLLVGSVAESVLRKAPCPVLTVRA